MIKRDFQRFSAFYLIGIDAISKSMIWFARPHGNIYFLMINYFGDPTSVEYTN